MIPKENERELNEIPDNLKKDLEIFMIENAIDVLKYVFVDDEIATVKKNIERKKVEKKV